MKFLLGVVLATLFLSPIKTMTEGEYTFEEAVTEALDDVRIRNNKLDDFLRENNTSSYELDWKIDPPTITFYNSKSDELVTIDEIAYLFFLILIKPVIAQFY